MVGPAMFVARAQLRSRWRAMLLLAIVVPALLLAVIPIAAAVVVAAAVYFGRGVRRAEVAPLLSAE